MAKKIKKLTRPNKGRKIAGVCIGLANYFKLDAI
jgi:phage shock protein PspC (stress-responsive transcriptional regulator)